MEKYEITRLLGKGAYGRALLCHEKDRAVVIKQVCSMSAEQLEEARREGEILAQLDHPNVVAFYDSFVETDDVEGNCLNIVMEYCDGGDLDAAIKRRRTLGRPFAELHVMRIFVQLTLALKYIHHHKILHRDIKPQNVFLTSDGCVKLGDFGVAKTLSSSASMAHTQLGTPYYLSPEIFNDENYDWSSDMWSLGVLAFELTTLALPFQAASLGKLAVRVLREEPPIPTCSADLQEVLGKLLCKQAQSRPSAADLLKLPFVRDHAKRLLDHTAATGLGGLEEDVEHCGDRDDDGDAADDPPPTPYSDDGVTPPASSRRVQNGDNTIELGGAPDATREALTGTPPGDGNEDEEDAASAASSHRENAQGRGGKSNPYARRPGQNPYARQRSNGSGPDSARSSASKDESVEATAAVSIQRSWREHRQSADDEEQPPPSVGEAEGEFATPRFEKQAAALTIQRSWRDLRTAPTTPRLPNRNRSAKKRAAPTPKKAASRVNSVKDSLARAKERGAARRALSEDKQRAQRIKMSNERGEPLQDFESPNEEFASTGENTVVVQLSEKTSGRPSSSFQATDDESFDETPLDETLTPNFGGKTWRVRGHITAAEERGRQRKALAEEKAARIQRDLDESRGRGRAGIADHGPISPSASRQQTPTKDRRRRRRWEEGHKWVPELPSLAASNSNLELSTNFDKATMPAAAGAAGRAVTAVKSARRHDGITPRRTERVTGDSNRRYRTKPSSQALKHKLASMLDDLDAP